MLRNNQIVKAYAVGSRTLELVHGDLKEYEGSAIVLPMHTDLTQDIDGIVEKNMGEDYLLRARDMFKTRNPRSWRKTSHDGINFNQYLNPGEAVEGPSVRGEDRKIILAASVDHYKRRVSHGPHYHKREGTYMDDRVVHAATQNALTLAARLGSESMGLPVTGMGDYKTSLQEAVGWFSEGILEGFRKDTVVRRVGIVVADSSKVNEARVTIDRYFS